MADIGNALKLQISEFQSGMAAARGEASAFKGEMTSLGAGVQAQGAVMGAGMAAFAGQAAIAMVAVESRGGRAVNMFRRVERGIGRAARVGRVAGGITQLGAAIGSVIPGLSKYRSKLKAIEEGAHKSNVKLETLALMGRNVHDELSRPLGRGGVGRMLTGGGGGTGGGGVVGRRGIGIGRMLLGGAAIAAAAGLGVGAALGKSAIGAAAQDEQTQISFEVLIGNPEEAKKTLADIRKLGADTPLEFPALADAGRKLIAFGESAANVPKALTRIGDISTAIQAPIGEIAEIYGKARVQGTLFAEDLNQLTGRGIPVLQEFAKQLGVPVSQIKKMASEGQVTFPMLEKAFIDLTSSGGKFEGMMKRQSGTIAGLWSTLKDNFEQFKISLGAPINDALRPVLKQAVAMTKDLDSQAAAVGGRIADMLRDIRTLVQALVETGITKGLKAALVLAFKEAMNELATGMARVATDFHAMILAAVAAMLDGLRDLPLIGERIGDQANELRQDIARLLNEDIEVRLFDPSEEEKVMRDLAKKAIAIAKQNAADEAKAKLAEEKKAKPKAGALAAAGEGVAGANAPLQQVSALAGAISLLTGGQANKLAERDRKETNRTLRSIDSTLKDIKNEKPPRQKPAAPPKPVQTFA